MLKGRIILDNGLEAAFTLGNAAMQLKIQLQR